MGANNQPPIVLASRGSPLALWQARFVASQLEDMGLSTTIKTVLTQGDRVQDRFLHEMGGKGVFVREIEKKLLSAEADIAVHSLKDLPVLSPPGLRCVALLPRHDPRDVLVMPPDTTYDLPDTLSESVIQKYPLCIGTGSLRRGHLLSHAAKQMTVIPIRGNVDTRLAKMKSGHGGYDALILAAASMERLSLFDGVRHFFLDPAWFVPSASQGVLAVQMREDHPLFDRIANLDCAKTRFCSDIERGVLGALGGDCRLPIGVHATTEEGQILVRAVLLSERSEVRVQAREDLGKSTESMIDHVMTELHARGVNAVLQELGLAEV